VSAQPAPILTIATARPVPSAAPAAAWQPREIPADGLVPLTWLYGAFHGRTRDQQSDSAKEWAGGHVKPCGRSYFERRGRELFVSIHAPARLPSGLTMLAYLKTGPAPETYAGQRLPPGSQTWSESDWKSYDDRLEFRRLWRAAGDKYPKLNSDQLTRVFNGEHAEWLKDHGYRCNRWGTVRSILERIDPSSPKFDGGIDGRGRRLSEDGGPCDPEAWEYFKLLWLDQQRPSVAACWDMTAAEAQRQGWAWPCVRTIERRIAKELPAFIADKARLAPRRWAAKYAPRIERDYSRVRPNECWQGDHSEFDFWSEQPDGSFIRLWLTAWLDERSRVCTGWVITPGPNSDTILAAFRDGVREYGAPLKIRIDNGKDYRAKAFTGGKRKPAVNEVRTRSICGRVETEVSFTATYAPQSKGLIERWFGTVHGRFDKTFDSYCGADTTNRPEDVLRRLKAGEIKAPRVADVPALFAKWLVWYRNHEHEGLEGKTPQWVFEHCDPIPKRTAPAEVLDTLLRRTVLVRVTKRGVNYRGIRYGQGESEVWKRIGQSVALRINPDDASYVDVLDFKTERFIVRAYNQRLRGAIEGDIREGERRKHRARKVADAARSAIPAAMKPVGEHAIDAMLERQQPAARRLAAGAEGEAIPARGVSLLTGAAAIARQSLPPAPRWAPGETPLGFDDLPTLSPGEPPPVEDDDAALADLHLSDNGRFKDEDGHDEGELTLGLDGDGSGTDPFAADLVARLQP
jgi:transposase InsO family protein